MLNRSPEVNLQLSQEQALVLFEFLSRYSEGKKLSVEDQAEDRVLFDVYCDLEKQLEPPFSPNCGQVLAAARAAVRDQKNA